jgi:hypothetical protein
LLAAVLLFESKGLKNQEKKEKEAKLVDVDVADILKITLKNESGTMTFQKDEKGGWLITEPLEAQADGMEVDGLAESFAGLRIERVVEAESKDLKTYEIPKREVTLWLKGKDLPVKVLVGMENPLDNTLFAKREDEKRVVLLSSSLKTNLDKKLFDFREKDVFKFDTADIRAIEVRAGDVAWAASKKDDGWELTAPIAALANGGKIDSLLYALSGLKAKEFVSENKSDEDIKKNGLDKPEYEARLSMPAGNKEAVVTLHKSDDKVYAAGSLSNKIVLVDGAILNDLGKKADEYREKSFRDQRRPHRRGRQGKGQGRREVAPRSSRKARGRRLEGRNLHPEDREPRSRGIHRCAQGPGGIRPGQTRGRGEGAGQGRREQNP